MTSRDSADTREVRDGKGSGQVPAETDVPPIRTRILRRHWPLLLAAAMCGSAAGVVLASYLPARYTATVRLTVVPALADQNRPVPAAVAAQYASRARSVAVRDRARGAAGTDPGRVTVATTASGATVGVAVTAPTPRVAALVADAYPALLPPVAVGAAAGGSGLVHLQLAAPARVTAASRAEGAYGAVGAAAGLLLGILAAMLAGRLSGRIRRADEITDLGLTLAGAVPGVAADGPLPAAHRPGSVRAGAYEHLADYVGLVALETRLRTVVVTGVARNEGRSSVAANLAVAVAAHGRTVAVVDADLRAPGVARLYGADASGPGLSDVLAGRADLAEALVPTGGVLLLPAGAPAANPAELMGSSALVDLLRRLRDRVDLVVVDAPPLLPYTDASLVALSSDGILVVARLGAARREPLVRAAQEAQRLPTRFLGIVANGGPAGRGRRRAAAARPEVAVDAAS